MQTSRVVVLCPDGSEQAMNEINGSQALGWVISLIVASLIFRSDRFRECVAYVVAGIVAYCFIIKGYAWVQCKLTELHMKERERQLRLEEERREQARQQRLIANIQEASPPPAEQPPPPKSFVQLLLEAQEEYEHEKKAAQTIASPEAREIALAAVDGRHIRRMKEISQQ
jgi:hypothetical protein